MQSAQIGNRIRQLAAQSDIPVIAFARMSRQVADIGWRRRLMKFLPIQHLLWDQLAFYGLGFGFDKLLERIGVDRRVYTAGDAKLTLDPFQPERDEDVARLKSLQTDIHDQFVAHIESRRGSRLKGDRKDLFSGAFWTGQRALDLGLWMGLAIIVRSLLVGLVKKPNF